MKTVSPELQKVRADADRMGISYHHRAGVERIQTLIQAHLDGEDINIVGEPAMEVPTYEYSGKKFLDKPVIPMTEDEYKDKLKKENRRNVNSLIRCRVQCMNPAKKDWPGEIISVGSAKLGTFKKYIPFNAAEPYHIPKIIYDMMKERKCSTFINGEDGRGHKTRKAIQINEYAIEVLDPLTSAEIKELATKQAMAAGKIGNA